MNVKENIATGLQGIDVKLNVFELQELISFSEGFKDQFFTMLNTTPEDFKTWKDAKRYDSTRCNKQDVVNFMKSINAMRIFISKITKDTPSKKDVFDELFCEYEKAEPSDLDIEE